jgi:hypothetical protein
MDKFLVNSLVTFGAGLIVAILGVPLLLRRIPRNGLYGLRTARTLECDRIWYEANHRAGLGLRLAGSGVAIGAAGMYLIGTSTGTEASMTWIMIGTLLASLAAVLVDCALFLKRLA